MPISQSKQQVDPFFSEANMKVLQKSIREANEGQFISKSFEDLKAMEKH